MDGGLPSIASPHACRPKPGARVFIIEGEIAAGKTELTRALGIELARRGLEVAAVSEPVDQWREVGILQKFYGSPSRYGYSFQTYVFATRVLNIARAVADAPDADIFLLERSPATDLIFMELQREEVDPVEMAMYSSWCEAYAALLPIDLSKATVLYLKTSLGCCMTRLSERSREGELASSEKKDASAVGGVSPGYQAKLRRAHEAFFQGGPSDEFPGLPASPFPLGSVIEIGPALADGNFRDPGPDRDCVIAEIVRLMGL